MHHTVRGFGPVRAWVLVALCMPAAAFAADADLDEVQAYRLTDAGLARYEQALTNLRTMPGGVPGACDDEDDDDLQSIDDAVAVIDETPGAADAIGAAGLTTREYVLFTFSLVQTGFAAWAASQPGGKLPPGVSQANVDFYNANAEALGELVESEDDVECE